MDEHDLNFMPTAWWVLLIIGIAFVIGGLAVALNRIQGALEHRVQFPQLRPKMVADPNGPYPRCKPPLGGTDSFVCSRCGQLYDPENLKACEAVDPCHRWRIDWVRVVPVVLVVLIPLVAAGCTSYSQTFRYQAPKAAGLKAIGTNGVAVPMDAKSLTWHEVRIRFWTFLGWGKAGRIHTETQTEEFIHVIRGADVAVGVETNAVKAIAEGVAEGTVNALTR